jgi:amino acid adenylation domain-containing protein
VSGLVHQLLEAAAHADPEQTAVVDGGRELRYGELERRSNQLAHLLRDLGVKTGDRVGLYLEKSLDSLVGIYGILKAGGAYVPFDPQAPTARLGYIARNADIRCLVTGAEKATEWNGVKEAGAPLQALVVLNAVQALEAPAGTQVVAPEALVAYADSPPQVQLSDSELAYILYTSGSTGEPKGVMLSHRNALAFVDWAAEEFEVRASDRVSSHAPLHFDLSVFDLFAAARGGATTVLVPGAASVFPQELARFIEANAITVWYSVPSILSLLVLRGGLRGSEFPRLRTILFAGEVFPEKYLFRLMDLLPHVRFCNLYGPTETNVCTWYEVPRDPAERPETTPIGKAIMDVQVFTVDDDGGVVDDGEVGELCVVGPTVMQGYWGDAERTMQRLVPAPPEFAGNGPMYRTGDLCKRGPTGDFVFLGRRDAQIKSRGYRIELGEIESALYAHPSVVECAVAAIPDELVTNRIKAYVVVRDETDEADLVGFCQQSLPKYMVPELFDFRAELPKSSTGKIARTALEQSQGDR